MATLTGTKIKDTYPGLIKTDDNAIVGATEKQLTDGEGNAIPMSVGTAGILFTGDADFTGANVTGLPEAGLVSGTGNNSMKSADSLTSTPAVASGNCSIAIGNGACATGDCSVAYGRSAISTGCRSIALGSGARATGVVSLAIGDNTEALANGSISIGRAIQKPSAAVRSITIAAPDSAFNWGSKQKGARAIQIGITDSGNRFADDSVAVGDLSWNSQDGAVAIGSSARGCATNAVALGRCVTAAKADTVTVKELETCVAGGGIYLTTPDGLNQPKLTVNDSQELLIGGNPVGGGAAGLESGTGTDSMQSAASLTTVAADAGVTGAIAIGCGALANAGIGGSIAIGQNAKSIGGTNTAGVAIGKNSCVGGNDGTAVGLNAKTNTNGQVFGVGSCVYGNQGVALGFGACAAGAATALGRSPVASGCASIAIGNSDAVGACSIALGNNSCAGAARAVALGADVTAAKADTVTVRSLETCVAGEGVIMTTPDGLSQYKVTIDNSGNLVTTIV